VKAYTRTLALVATATLTLAALTACSTNASISTGPGDPSTWSAPAPWDLSTPESSVASYLDWVSFSYKMANSEIALGTMTPDEAVRVDSYIQLNREKDRVIEQQLLAFTVRSASMEETSAVVAATEDWRYRYFSLTTLLYTSEELLASYETTYTLVLQDGAWLVDTVEATPLGEIE